MRDAVITLVSLAILVRALVLPAAIAGLYPRHWSGIPLSGVDVYFLGIHPRYRQVRLPEIDHVTDQLAATGPRGVVVAALLLTAIIWVGIVRRRHRYQSLS